ncbi:uncharacterized protein LODBEIA_P30500 [Lodderomyces beijingensis]|uniref:Vacuolar protein sorting-associated protein 27 n=1 Tax=Lodderomyces beijingensis TaxID=1775926 RepID=A0ABP0ZNZ1_9ASCO
MSWFGSSTSALQLELDNKITDATSESIPNGELDLSVALEITDFIRSKKLPALTCMRCLKKRLNLVYSNPNLISSTLKLIDLCVKNCGFHFLTEISSREFMDYLVDFIFKIHYDVRDSAVKHDEAKSEVGEFILTLIKQWTNFFQGQLQLNYVEKKYQTLVNDGYQFPSAQDHPPGDSNFVDSEVPPDWIDSDQCMICYTPFSMLNRKHHCRACGGVYCQEHSKNNTKLVNLGIMEPVRVCDNCYTKQKHKNGGVGATGGGSGGSGGAFQAGGAGAGAADDDEDEQLRKAIELSLKETGVSAQPVPSSQPKPEPPKNTTNEDEDEDEEMKAAIAVSLKEYESTQHVKQPSPRAQGQPEPVTNPFQEPEQPESDLYNISFNPSNQPAFANQHSYQRQAAQAPVQASAQKQEPVQKHEHQQGGGSRAKPYTSQDLSQAEEEQINLFITLMNNVRGDPKKQANIMYDQNLNEMHAQIIRLKPKVNKSLREAMDRYAAFLEMSNKLSTITRLYDQFWEQKLNMGMQTTSLSAQNTTFINPNTPGFTAQGTGYPNTSLNARQSGVAMPNAMHGTGYASTSYNAQSTAPPPTLSAQNTAQQGSVSNFQNAMHNQEAVYPNPGSESSSHFSHHKQRLSQQKTSYPPFEHSFSIPEPPNQSQRRNESNIPRFDNFAEQVPTEPDYDDDEDEETNVVPSSSVHGQSIYPATENLPESSESDVERNGQNYHHNEQNEQSNRNEYVTVQLPNYPPPEDLNSQLPAQSYIRHASSTLPPNAYEDASTKFPTLQNVEDDYERHKKSNESTNTTTTTTTNNNKAYENLPQLPSNLPTFDVNSQQQQQQQEKKRYEPEPLIDL